MHSKINRHLLELSIVVALESSPAQSVGRELGASQFFVVLVSIGYANSAVELQVETDENSDMGEVYLDDKAI